MIQKIKYLLIPIAIFWAWQHHWLTDDCFITFRYIANLWNGNGLVFNAGEYVEGFTHPLWLFMLAPFYPNLEIASQILGLIFFGGLIFLLTKSGWLAALLVVLNMEMRIWATGGLETMMFTFLVFLSVWATLNKKTWVGWVLLAMVSTRPDGILIAGIILIFNWRYYKPLLLLIPLLALRYFYYGDLLPNPYYVKSGGSFYFEQGFYYIWTYLSVYVTTFLVLIGLKFIRHREVALPMSIIFAYLILFVARVGGDFMYARFIIPVIPLIYFVIEYSLSKLKNVSLLVAVVILVPAEVYLRNDLFYYPSGEHKPAFELKGVTDEQWYWSNPVNGEDTFIDIDRKIATEAGKMLSGKVVLLKSQCAFGYYLGTNVICIDNSGLTDRFIAKQPLANRSRVGHERSAPEEYLKQRGVDYMFLVNRSAYNKDNKFAVLNIADYKIKVELFKGK